VRNELYLVDTSVWIGYFSARSQTAELKVLFDRVDGLVTASTVAMTGMVRLEILGGARDERDYQRLVRALAAMPSLLTDENRWEDAASLAFQLRRRGVTVPFPDVLIASIAIHEQATVLHRDRHFDTIAAYAPLQVESYVP
jgi:predicted nucleic acid-binding protein